MRIVDLDREHREEFACCLEEWSPEAGEAGPRRGEWVERFLPLGLRAKLALDDDGVAAGMIQYLPIERSTVAGEGLYFIPCVWVHGHRQGRGDRRGRGAGSSLLAAAEEDARALGAKGMAAWGLRLPVWMRASWFRRHGYRKAENQGVAALVWKPFAPDALPPRWHPRGRTLPDPVPGKVNVTLFVHGWCMGQNLALERTRRAAAGFGEAVALREIDTSGPGAVARWGFSDAIFVDGRELRTGPPPSFERIRSLLARRVARLPR